MTDRNGEEHCAFPEAPDGFTKFKSNSIVALLDEPDQLEAAVKALAEAGFDPQQVTVLCGQKGAERLDISGRHHGLKGRIYRLMEWLSDDQELRFAARDHLASGGYAVSAPARDDQTATATRILAAHGGHGIVHFGRAHFETRGAR